MRIWTCKIGEVEDVPGGADGPMRDAVESAYRQITGKESVFLFSGWGGSLDEIERACVERREPLTPGIAAPALAELSMAMQNDEGYAWTWHCNVACAMMDEGAPHGAANAAAARFMRAAFGVDTTKAPGSDLCLPNKT